MSRAARLAKLLLSVAGLVLGGEGAPEAKAPPAPSFPPVSGLEALRGGLRPLPDGRVELYYDGSDPAQLGDWRVEAGPAPQMAEGELRLGSDESHTLRHVMDFLGAVDVAGACRIVEPLGSHGHCSVALHAGPGRGYWLNLREWHPELYREDGQAAVLAAAEARLRQGLTHTFHVARAGNQLRAWLGQGVRLRAPDSAYHQGSVLLRAWRVRAGFRGLWLMGRPDPQWLAANPGVAGQLEALRLYHGGVAAVQPLWASGQRAEALARAKALAAEEPFAKAPAAAKWLVEDAQAVADFWQAVETALARLKPGDALQAEGAQATFQRYEQGLLIVRAGGADVPKKPASLADGELLALAARVRQAEGGRDHLALALPRLGGDGADAAAALAELELARKAGADVARHRGLLIPRPPTAEKSGLPSPAAGPRVAYEGKPLYIEAEAAVARVGAMEVGRDEAASGGRFVWEPPDEDGGQYGKPSSRVVFHVLANEPATVYLWARVRPPSSSANSFFVAVAPEGVESPSLKAWHLAPKAGWHWEPFNLASAVDEGSTRPSPVPLQPGVNALVFAVRERAVGLDRLYLSNGPEPPSQ
ncbi:MAG TPA: hypothetical protein PLE19_08670 [Planctomycetota bacterium]|nr:hypothetical protein [Planctomycetota bacterium]HRR81468.1 hypothetical protein [Planctomycetota bacterium]HRT93745.1 hypothetical protein [Planctomycetota bacterium]